MSAFGFNCPNCQQHLSAEPSMIGKEVACPTCSGRFIVPEPLEPPPQGTLSNVENTGICPYCRTAITTTDHSRVCPLCHTSHHADCWEENKGCTVFGCAMAPQDEDKISITEPVAPDTIPRHAYGQNPVPPFAPTSTPLFLHIPVGRLVFMSILSLGIYEAYWIYKNWRYLNERDNLKIQPFWRGAFPIFFCHSIFRAIRVDRQLNAIEQADFSAGGLATGWIVLTLLGVTMGRSNNPVTNLVGIILSLPSFLFFIPVQNFINRVNAKRNPAIQYSPWSAGHIVCIIFGILMWLLILAGVLS